MLHSSPMKRTILFSLLMCLILVTMSPPASAQEPEFKNEIGLFLAPDDLDTFSAPMEDYVFSMFSMYLVLMNPYLDSEEAPYLPGSIPVTNISGFECRLDTPYDLVLYDDVQLPVSGTILGMRPDMTVGYSEPVVVDDGVVVLAEVPLFSAANQRAAIYLRPISDEPEIPGHMAAVTSLVPGQWTTFRIYPISGSIDAPVFIFDPEPGEPVAAESATWSDVKAIYR